MHFLWLNPLNNQIKLGLFVFFLPFKEVSGYIKMKDSLQHTITIIYFDFWLWPWAAFLSLYSSPAVVASQLKFLFCQEKNLGFVRGKYVLQLFRTVQKLICQIRKVCQSEQHRISVWLPEIWRVIRSAMYLLTLSSSCSFDSGNVQ